MKGLIMFSIKFKAGNNIFTYTSMNFCDELQLKQYFFEQYIPKYFKHDKIKILKITQY